MTTPTKMAADGVFLLEEATIISLMKHELKGHRPTPYDIGADIALPPNVVLAVLERLEEAQRIRKMIGPRSIHYWVSTKQERDALSQPPDLSTLDDWEANVTVGTVAMHGKVVVDEYIWMEAMYRHGPSVRELVEDQSFIYVTPVEGDLAVACSFRLEFADNDLVAHGTAYRAQQFPDGNHEIDFHAKMAESTLHVQFRSLRTRETVRRHLDAQTGQ